MNTYWDASANDGNGEEFIFNGLACNSLTWHGEKPAIGQVGDTYVDNNGEIYVCTSATNNEWAALASNDNETAIENCKNCAGPRNIHKECSWCGGQMYKTLPSNWAIKLLCWIGIHYNKQDLVLRKFGIINGVSKQWDIYYRACPYCLDGDPRHTGEY